jgi:signal transduction histidine kinase
MTGAYVYTPSIWPPLAAAIFLAALGMYAWRRRAVPAAPWLAAGSLLGALWLLGIAIEAAAVAPPTKIVWYKFQAALLLPGVTAVTCFALEYTYPGRWLTRRNLTLLWLPPLLFLLLILTNASKLMWRQMQIAPDGSVVPYRTTPGAILVAYGFALILVNTAAFVWLFIRSPQHRWPMALMLFGQIAGRALYLLNSTRALSTTRFDPDVLAIVLAWTMYAIALFGFHILDPLPAARATAIEQMREGMVVLDDRWRIANVNPAAARILGAPAAQVRGKTLPEILPGQALLTPLPAGNGSVNTPPTPAEIVLGAGSGARCYVLDVSPLKDQRGLVVGRLLLLRDMTDQRRAQAQILEQQRTLAVLKERERLARELHDGLGQALAAAHLQASTAKLLLAQGKTAQVAKCLDDLADTTLLAQADVREYLLGAITVLLTDGSFFATLREYLRRFSQQYVLPVELTVPPQIEEQGLAQTVEVQLLRIIQEALSNVRKHATAGRAQVIFSLAGAQAQIAIDDDGRGFDLLVIAAQTEGYGLRAMRERAEAVGGSLSVISAPGQGTQVVVRVPMKG